MKKTTIILLGLTVLASTLLLFSVHKKVTPLGGQRIHTGTLTVDSLTNCDTLDTDSSGNFACGTDAGTTESDPIATAAGYITDGNTGWDNIYGFVTSTAGAETDPIFMAASTSLDYLTNISGLNISLLNNDSGYITSSIAVESDPIWLAASSTYLTTASAASTYVSLAYASSTYQPLGSYLTTIAGLNISSLTNDSGYITTTPAETDPVYESEKSQYVTGTPWTLLGYVTGTPWTTLGYITGVQVPANETDSAHDECSEISGCVVGAITTSTGLTTSNFASANISQWTNDAGYVTSSEGGVAWGNIIGTLSDQTDLQTAIDAKLSTTSAASTYLTYAYATSTYLSLADFAGYNFLDATMFSAAGTGLTIATTTDSVEYTWTNPGYITDGNTNWDNIYGLLTGYNSSTALALFSGVSSTNATTTNFVLNGAVSKAIAFFNSAKQMIVDSLFVWDTSTKRLGVNTSTPATTLDVYGTSTMRWLVVDDGSQTTTTVAIGNPGVGKTCLWNGASWTITSFASNSITPVYTTSTDCF